MENKELSELEELRAQMTLLKDKLSREEIVSDKLLRQAMKGNVHAINSRVWVSAVCAVVVIFYFPFWGQLEGLSIWLVAYTILIMLMCLVFDFVYHKDVKPEMMNGNLLEVAMQMRKLKKAYVRWRYYAYPMVIVWFGWLLVEILSTSSYSLHRAIIFALALTLGFAVGLILGLRSERKIVKNIDEIINQIER